MEGLLQKRNALCKINFSCLTAWSTVQGSSTYSYQQDPRLTHYLLSDCVCMWAGLVNIRFTNAMPASEASMATTFLHKRISTGTSTRLKHSLLRSQRAIKCTAPLDYDWFLRLFLFALFLQTNDGGCPSTMRNPATVSWASTKRSLTAWTSIFQVRETKIYTIN